jgi:ketosteroid isomerase-like protein
VDAVRGAWEAVRTPRQRSDLPLYDPEVEVQYPFLDRVYRGLPGVQEYFRDWLAVWDEFGSEVEEWIDAGDSVIAVMHSWGRGKQSGARVEERNAHVWTLRNGKLWRLRVYATRAEALKAVGLEE